VLLLADSLQSGEHGGMSLRSTPTPGRVETFKGRQLRLELLRLRGQAGLSVEEVAERLDWSKGKISRIETGVSRVSPSDVRLLLGVYGTHASATVDELVELARAARTRGWWQPYADLFPHAYVGLEAEARSVYSYETQLVPGLLQTSGYVQCLLRSYLPDIPEDEVARRVEARKERQNLLTRADAPAVWIVLDETVLRRPVGGVSIMREQLGRIAGLAELPNLTIQVLPFEAGSHAAMGVAFTILGLNNQFVVYLEHLTGQLYADDQMSVDHYTNVFDQLREKAAKPDRSLSLIMQAAVDL